MKHIFLIIFSFFILQKTIHAQADACFSVSEMLVTIESNCDAAQTLVLTDTIYNNLDNYGAGTASTDTDGDGIPDTGDDTFSNYCFFGVYPESITYFHVVGDGNTYNIDTSIDCVPAGSTPLEITLMAVYELGCDGMPILCGVGNYEDPALDMSAFETVAGTDYYLAIADVGTDFGLPVEGEFCLIFDMVEVYGCTDPMADNYDPNANTDDGTCTGNINDTCESAFALSLTDTTYTGLSNASNGQGNDIGSLSCAGLTSTLNNVAYYEFVGDGNAYFINTNIDCVSNGNGIDFTYLRIFAADCTTQIACGLGGEDTGFPMATLPALYTTSGVTYYIAVSDLGDFHNINEGDFCLEFDIVVEGCTDSNAVNYNPNANVDNGSCAYPPINDECVDATPIMLSSSGPFTNIYATSTETSTPLGCFFGDDEYQATVYFTFEGDGIAYTITTAIECLTGGAANNDTQLALFEGDCQNLIACNDDIGDLAFTSLLSTITVETQLGVQYYLLVDGWAGMQGDFCLDIEEAIYGCTDATAINYNPDASLNDGSCQYPPANDLCENAYNLIVGTSTIGTNVNATPSGFTLDLTCGDTDPYQHDVFYTMVGTGEPVTISSNFDCHTDATNPYLYNPQIAVYEAACGGFPLICYNNVNDGTPSTIEVSFPTVTDTTYYILIDGMDGEQGEFCLDAQYTITGCTDAMALNYNADAVFDDGSCQYEPICNPSARFSNNNTRLIARNFTQFADDAFIRNFLTAERTYIRYQYEINRILESDDAKYQQVNEDFDAIKEVALSTLFESLLSKQSVQVTGEHLQLIERFLTSLSNATNKGKLRAKISEARRYLSVMKGKEIKDALIAYDRAGNDGLSDFTPPSNEQLQDDFEANIRHTIGRNSQLMMTLPTDGTVHINIHNTNGQLMQSYPETRYNKGEHITDLDKSRLTSGMYFIHINYVDDTGKSIQKTLKMPVLY